MRRWAIAAMPGGRIKGRDAWLDFRQNACFREAT
jgi:hypothetical protein